VNHYPGLKCDVPIHAYNLAWAPKHDWTWYYAAGAEIRGYIEDAARKFELEKYIQFNSKVVEAAWDEESGKWKLKGTRLTGAVTTAAS
jgi:cation diffusion facilitator CzcD-associated flavoprotein CzcO